MAGYEVKLAVEWDDHAVECYKLNFPNTDVYHGDIGKLSVDQILQRTGLKVGELDVLDGSPPCQGFSISGKRDFKDERNQLFKEYCRLLKGLQPKAFVTENVKGMVLGKMKITFVECLKMLKDCGYNVSVRVLKASNYGVPQSRERTIFIGYRNDLNLKPMHPKPNSIPITVIEALKNCPPTDVCMHLKIGDNPFKFWQLMRPGENAGKYNAKGNYFNFIKVNPLKPCPTISKTIYIRTSRFGGLVHWKEPRSLNINEAKRLGSFPDDFKLVGKFEQQWARIGNSVPPLMMKAIAEQIKLQLMRT